MLVVNVSIENRGYDLFNTSPEHFRVTVNSDKHPCDVDLSDLRTFDIPSGGRIIGKLAFEVPEGTDETGYSLSYSGPGTYNVQWFEIDRTN